MPAILYVTPNKALLQRARGVFAENYPNILLFESQLDSDGSEIAAAIAAYNAKVVIGRGFIVSLVKSLDLPVTVLESPVTALDLVAALEGAKTYGRRVAAVASPSLLSGIDTLARLVDVSLRVYTIENQNHMELSRQAVNEGADVIIGGFNTAHACRLMHFPHVFISSNTDGLLQVAKQATDIVAAVRQEKERYAMLRDFFEYSADGVVAVDSAGHIVVCNPVAARMADMEDSGRDALGRPAETVFPALALSETIASGENDLGSILCLNGTDIVCNKIAVLVNGRPVAAVASFQDVNSMQRVEARVRRSIYDTGHAASASFDDILGISPAIKKCIAMAKEFALVDSTVLLLGETGSGKEIFAQSIHNYSPRRQGPFVAVNCAALPGSLLESELFGYDGGAFTGANPKGKPGMFELAHGGTLFLDEIGEMDPFTQGKLLRVLQERKIMRLGSNRVIPVDVRLLTATNRDLPERIQKGTFREDLYYRLNVLHLTIPPLRERKADIGPLSAFFLRAHSHMNKKSLVLSPEALEELKEHPWYGNVRELQNFMERLAVLQKQGVITAQTVLARRSEEARVQRQAMVNDPEMAEIYDALSKTGGNYTRAADLLGVSRITLWRKLKKNAAPLPKADMLNA